MIFHKIMLAKSLSVLYNNNTLTKHRGGNNVHIRFTKAVASRLSREVGSNSFHRRAVTSAAPFCHNASLVTHFADCDKIPEDEVFAFLGKRRGLLDGVCITGRRTASSERPGGFYY